MVRKIAITTASLLFLYTAVSILLSFSTFQEALKTVALIPTYLTEPVAFGTPVITLLLPVALMLLRLTKGRLIRPPFVFLILIALCTVYHADGQIAMQRSFYVEDSLDHTPLGFALLQLTKIKDSTHKLYELRANSKGIIELTGVLAGDSVTYKISVPGYQPVEGTGVVRSLYLRHVLLAADRHDLETVTVKADSRGVHYKPGEIQIRWNKYARSPSEPLSNVIQRMPNIISKSLDKNTLSLETSGGRKVSVFLDGRRLSDQEVQALPAMMIAKASLVTFPSALDAQAGNAVLYLSSSMFAYNYSYNDLSAYYDLGRTGPSFTFRHTQKTGLWSNNVMINGYHYAMPATTTDIDIDGAPYQHDSASSDINSLILVASLTKKSLKNNLFTIGVNTTLYKGDGKGYHQDFGGGSTPNAFNSNIDSRLMNATLYAAWHYRTGRGNTWQVNGTGAIQPTNKTEYQSTGTNIIESVANTPSQTYSLGAGYILKLAQLGSFKWGRRFSLGAKSQYSKTERQFNQSAGGTLLQHSREYNLYGGLSSSITNDFWKIQASLMGNYAWQNGFDYAHFNSGYIYPKIDISFAPSDKQSLSLSLSATTFRPEFKMVVTDSSYASNWIISKGDRSIRAEHDYLVNLLYNLTAGKWDIEIEAAQTYFDNGIVQSWELIKEPSIQLVSSYQNVSYTDRELSVLTSYHPLNDLYLKWSGRLHYLSFKQDQLPESYKDGYYFATDLNINYYSTHMGNFAFIGAWDGNPLIYLKQTKTRPTLSFRYDYDLSKTVNISAAVYDIFASGEWKDVQIFRGPHQLTQSASRALSVGLTWKFGQMFGAPQAGSSQFDAVPADTKKLH